MDIGVEATLKVEGKPGRPKWSNDDYETLAFMTIFALIGIGILVGYVILMVNFPGIVLSATVGAWFFIFVFWLLRRSHKFHKFVNEWRN